MKKKIIAGIVSLVLGVSACALVGCSCGGNGNGNGNSGSGSGSSNIFDMPSSETVATISLNKTDCVMTVGDELELIAQYVPQTGVELHWTSSNEEVVTVTDGKLLALTAGEATVTATYGTLETSCNVSVSFSNIYPTLDFENDVQEVIITNTSEKVNLFAKTKFNGKVFDDGELTYELSDPTLGQISADGTFTPEKAGESDLKIQMQWRGFTMEKTVNLQVKSVKRILVNQGMLSEIVLYGKAEFNGQTYKTNETLEIVAEENNAAKEYNVEILNNDGVVSFNESTNTITALQGGTAELKISFTADDQSTFYKILPITVRKHTVQTTIPLFSLLDGVGKGENTLSELLDGETLLFANSGGASLEIQDGYKLFGLTALADNMTELKVNAESKSFSYELTLEAYTKVLTTAQDFVDAFNVDGEITGYYYLANDIAPKQDGTYEGVKMTKSVISTKAFRGVFEGAGHTVNLELQSSNGLFTYLRGATVRNARFNFKIAANAGKTNSGLALYSFEKNYLSDIYVNVENLSDACETFGAISRYYNGVVSYTRVVVETPSAEELASYNTTNMGALAATIDYINATTGKETVTHADVMATDVYVISSLPLAAGAKAANPVPWTIYAQNKMRDTNGDGSITTDDIDTANKITYFPQKVNDGKGRVYSYATVAEMIAAAQDLSKYAESAYWDVSTGAPVWNGND